MRRGGSVTIMGVYGTNYDNFPLSQMLDKGLKVRIGQAPVHTRIDQLMQLIVEGKVKTDDIISHTMPLSDAAYAYEIFNDKKDRCVKVVLKP